MSVFFDLQDTEPRHELSPRDVSHFLNMKARDQALAVAHLAAQDLAFRDDIDILQNMMAAPDQVRLKAIVQDDVETYARLEYLGLGPETIEDEQDDLLHAFKMASGHVAGQILGNTPEHLHDDLYMADVRTRLIRYGNLPALAVFLDYDPNLNHQNSLGETALQTLSQTLFDSMNETAESLEEEFPLQTPDVAAVAYLPILGCLLAKGATLFPENVTAGTYPYRLKDDEIPERPELAFAFLAKKDAFFESYLAMLSERFSDSASAYERWQLRRQALSGLSVVSASESVSHALPKTSVRASLKAV